MGITKTGPTMNNNNSFTVSNPFACTGHLDSLENFDTFSHTSNNIDLIIQESLLILTDCPTLNEQKTNKLLNNALIGYFI